jgi:hypothetical protein
MDIAASLTGDHASNVTPGMGANKITFLAGPRYTWKAWQEHATLRAGIVWPALHGI